jgi:hypothetical protein
MIGSAWGQADTCAVVQVTVTGRHCPLHINPSKVARKRCETPGNSAVRAIYPRVATGASENRTPTTTLVLHKTQCREVKINPITLNAGLPLSDQLHVGAEIPPHSYIRRERPSTPSAYMALTRPVVPPDGSFIFGGKRRVASAALVTTPRLVLLRICRPSRATSSRTPSKHHVRDLISEQVARATAATRSTGQLQLRSLDSNDAMTIHLVAIRDDARMWSSEMRKRLQQNAWIDLGSSASIGLS